MFNAFLHSPLFAVVAGALLGALLLVPIAMLNAHFSGMPTLGGICADHWVFNVLVFFGGTIYRRGPVGVGLLVAAFVVLAPWAFVRMTGFIDQKLINWECALLAALALADREKRALTVVELRRTMGVNDFFIGYTIGMLAKKGLITARREGSNVIIEFAGGMWHADYSRDTSGPRGPVE